MKATYPLRRCVSASKTLVFVALTMSSLLIRAQSNFGPFQNGSFELPGQAANSAVHLVQGSTALSGWVIGGTGGYVGLFTGVSAEWGPGDFKPVDGDAQLHFNVGAGAAGTWIAQTFETVPGVGYAVKFYVGRNGNAEGGPVSMTASAISQTGNELASLQAFPQQEGYGPAQTMMFRAISRLTTLQFLDTSTGDISATDIVLDAVSVSAVDSGPRRAKATAQVVNGFLVGIDIIDGGAGYTEAPKVQIFSPEGSGASAVATVSGGAVTSIKVLNAGSGYTSPVVVIDSPPFAPELKVRVTRVGVDLKVMAGKKYLLESSKDFFVWTPAGDPFVAQDENLTEEFVVEETGRFFRVLQVP